MKSFKKLKQQLAKGKKQKTGSGPDPTHEAFLKGLKGLSSPLVDVDFIQTEFWLVAIVAEENSQIHVHAIEQDTP